MKFVFLKKCFFSYIFFLTSFVCYSQQTMIDAPIDTKYSVALDLFNNKAYAAAQTKFASINKTAEKHSNLKSNTAYYDALCALKLHQPKAIMKLLTFIEENPNSDKINAAFFNIANDYFSNKKGDYGLKWYQKIDITMLSKEEGKERNFKMGYASLINKEFPLAKKLFLPLFDDATYGNDAQYYYGFIAYQLEEFEIAETTFKKIENIDTYQTEIAYYLLDASFQKGEFERCIEIGKRLMKNKKFENSSEISKIIGESYFNLKKYREALFFLEGYAGKKGKWNTTDFYQLGFAYYSQNDFENAINNFNKIIEKKNDIAQNAYYHLGECYLNLNKKAAALNAFKTASEMDFNIEIKQDAALNYAKLSYEAGNPFESVAEVLQGYLKTYPNSKAYEEIKGLVISSFLYEQDYKGALAFLAEKKSKKNEDLISEISLYRGLQLVNNQKLKEAIPFFEESKNSAEVLLKEKAKYWEAETLYRLDKYKEALAKFTTLKEGLKSESGVFTLIDYNLGYCNFKLKQYEKAGIHFENFLKNNSLEPSLKEDATVRLSDSYFAIRRYKNAIDSYSIVVKNSGADADYAQYQIGMSYGFIGNNKAKIAALSNVISKYQNSTLIDDALFQLANTYTLIKENKKAHQTYNKFVEKHPNSIFLPKVLVRQGLLYYNDAENEKALKRFEKTVKQFPNSPDAIEAVANARNIYIDNGNLENYFRWIKTLKFINVTNADLDNTTFAVAEKKYFDAKKEEETIKILKKYIRSFPDGIHRLKANYYLADTFFKAKQFDKATPYYQVVLEAGQSEYSEDGLSKLSQIFLEKEAFNNALPILIRLEKEAHETENVLFAQSNLMKGYYETAAFDLAFKYAKKILLKEKLETKLENDAKLIIARILIKKKDFNTAEEYYSTIEASTTGLLKAEALYYNAFFKNQQKKYAASNKVIQNLIANYSSYTYWAVKSYVVMGKNYYGLDDVYQANFVLENIIKNFKQFEDIIEEAEKELKIIKENEAKITKSASLIKEENTQNKEAKKE